VGIDADIMKSMNAEAEKEAAAEAGANPTPEQVKDSWKKVAAKAAWKFSKEKGFPAFKSACKFSYAQAKALGKRPTAPGTKKIKDLRAQDVTVFGTVVGSERSPVDKSMYKVSFISDTGTDVKDLPANEKLIVMERGRIRA
jgi:hypothetical protein